MQGGVQGIDLAQRVAQNLEIIRGCFGGVDINNTLQYIYEEIYPRIGTL